MKWLRIWWLRWRLADLDADIEFQRSALGGLEIAMLESLTKRRQLLSELAQIDCPVQALRAVKGRV